MKYLILVTILIVNSSFANAADNNPFSGARSMKVKMHRDHHPKWCVRNWNYDYDQKIPIRESAIAKCFADAPWDNRHQTLRVCVDKAPK